MSSLFGVNKPNTNLRKNPFDLSEKALFTMSPGMLLPFFTKEVNPGEKVKINIAALTRTLPVNTAAFVRNRQYFHFFFVPFRQLWSGWDNFINGVDYKSSALQKGKKYSKVPSIDIFQYLSKLRVSQNEKRGLVVRGIDGPEYGLRDSFGIPYIYGMSRLLELLEYGIMGPKSQSMTPSRVGTVSSSVDSREFYTDLLGYCDNLNRLPNGAESVAGNLFNLFRVLAYQKIYSDFYKRDDYEQTNPEAFNFDDFDPSVEYNLDNFPVQRFIEMFQLRYRWLPKDYFTGVVPSELFNVPSSVGESISLPNDAAGSKDVKFDASSGKDVSFFSSSSNGSISTKSIRAAFAIEKHLRLTRRASGQDYISQISAHYGFTPPKGRGDKVDFLGGFANDITISDVMTTAMGRDERDDVSKPGDIFGKGLGAMDLSKDIEFLVPEHGLIMGIVSVVPELDYSAIGVNAFNSKFERGDYFHPEFQDLGLQPLFSHELVNSVDFRTYTDMNALLGYVPRYSEYKVSFDKLFGPFRNGSSLSAWSADVNLFYNKNGIIPSSLRVNPKCLDRIFGVQVDGKTDNDTFMTSSQVLCKIIRPMSITGQNL